MTPYRHAVCGIDRRTFVVGAGALASAGLVDFATSSPVGAQGRGEVKPAPNPIPGGLEVAPGVVLHVFAPGDPSITLPFSGFQLGGFDVEPGTITDFEGSSAVAFHVGTARGHDGTTFNLETDMRAFQGTYVVDGVEHQGSFALV
jgi:hypothetical protein